MTCIGVPPHHLAPCSPTSHRPRLIILPKKLVITFTQPAPVCLSPRQEFLQNSQTPASTMPSHLFTTIFLLPDSSSAFHIAYLSDVTNCIAQFFRHKNAAHSSVPSKSAQMPEKTAEGMKMSRACQKSAPRLAGLQLKESDQSSSERESDAIHMYGSGYINFLSPEFPPFCGTMMNYLGHHRVVPWATRQLGGQKSRKLGIAAVDNSPNPCGHMSTLSSRHHCQTIDAGQDESH